MNGALGYTCDACDSGWGGDLCLIGTIVLDVDCKFCGVGWEHRYVCRLLTIPHHRALGIQTHLTTVPKALATTGAAVLISAPTSRARVPRVGRASRVTKVIKFLCVRATI